MKNAIAKSNCRCWPFVNPQAGFGNRKVLHPTRCWLTNDFNIVFRLCVAFSSLAYIWKFVGAFPCHCSRPTQTTWPQQGSCLQSVALAISTWISVVAGVWITILEIPQYRLGRFHALERLSLLLVQVSNCSAKVHKPKLTLSKHGH